MHEKSNTLQIKSHFRDFDQFSQEMRGWNLCFSQLDRGHFEGKLHQISIPDFLLMNVKFNRLLKQDGEQPEGMRTFALLSEDSSQVIWYTRQTMHNCLMLFPKDTRVEAVSYPGFNVYALSISEKLLTKILHRDDTSSLKDLLLHGGRVESCPDKIQALRYLLKQTFLLVQSSPGLVDNAFFQKELHSNLTHMFSCVLNFEGANIDLAPIHERTQLILDIKSWLEEALPEHHSVYDLCEKFRVTHRTMQRAFIEKCGVPPKQYLLALRLNKVRKDLCYSDFSHGKVSDVANRWGFWHMGDFAQFYRRQFGELPSETLRRSS